MNTYNTYSYQVDNYYQNKYKDVPDPQDPEKLLPLGRVDVLPSRADEIDLRPTDYNIMDVEVINPPVKYEESSTPYKRTNKIVKVTNPIIFNEGKTMRFTLYSKAYMAQGSLILSLKIINESFNYLQLDGSPHAIIKSIVFRHKGTIFLKVRFF